MSWTWSVHLQSYFMLLQKRKQLTFHFLKSKLDQDIETFFV